MGKTSTYAYDDAGRLSYAIDRNGERTVYAYTPTGKLETVSYDDSSRVDFAYDHRDNLTEIYDSLGATYFAYHPDDGIESVTDPHGFTTSYDKFYENGKLVVEIVYPGSKKVIYRHDELGRLKTVTLDWLGASATYDYDADGRLDSLVNFNGVATDYGIRTTPAA